MRHPVTVVEPLDERLACDDGSLGDCGDCAPRVRPARATAPQAVTMVLVMTSASCPAKAVHSPAGTATDRCRICATCANAHVVNHAELGAREGTYARESAPGLFFAECPHSARSVLTALSELC
jgi:hypothetical protein